MVPENSPSVSMWPYLLDSSQTRRLNEINACYFCPGRIQRAIAAALHMNAGALRVWREMGMRVTIIGESHRPPRDAMLCFGMPFS